jgi:hypothetical protein
MTESASIGPRPQDLHVVDRIVLMIEMFVFHPAPKAGGRMGQEGDSESSGEIQHFGRLGLSSLWSLKRDPRK